MSVLGILVVVCLGCLGGYWWLGHTATPGQRELEERLRANRGAIRRTLSVPGIFGRLSPGKGHQDADWWTRPAAVQPVPEPDEHKQPWR